MKVLDDRTLGFADYSGNRQYITLGNTAKDDRVALFFMDYPNRTRLKLLGRLTTIGLDDPRIAELEDPDYRAPVERGMLIQVEAFDWNCPQHITPRFTEAEIQHHTGVSLRKVEYSSVVPERPEKADAVLGEGPLELVVSGIRQLTPRVRAFEFRHPAGEALPEVEAGAHLEVPVPLADGSVSNRHYSIASNPARRDIYEIAVLADGEGSQALHSRYGLGTRIRVPLPGNFFPLREDDRPVILIAGGIGITPIKAMAQTLDNRGTPFVLHYAGRRHEEMAYRDRLERQLGERIRVYDAHNGERLDLAAVFDGAGDHSRIYCCGPSRLIDGVLEQSKALGIERERVHFERFEAVGR